MSWHCKLNFNEKTEIIMFFEKTKGAPKARPCMGCNFVAMLYYCGIFQWYSAKVKMDSSNCTDVTSGIYNYGGH